MRKSSNEPVTGELLEMTLDLRRTKPWHFAEADSMWEITGSYPTGSKFTSFTSCLARVLPGGVTGTSTPIFELLIYGERPCVDPVHITFGQELLLVKCSDPLTAYYAVDQVYIDEALNRRDENR
jgi:hypothetical protein